MVVGVLLVYPYNYVQKMFQQRTVVGAVRAATIVRCGVIPSVTKRTLTAHKNEGQDLVTHTGQSWAADDYRNARYMNTPKQVNPKWSIDLIKAVPPVEVEGRVAVCEGGPSAALGHPKIYINLDQPGNHSCSYCGIRFIKKQSAH